MPIDDFTIEDTRTNQQRVLENLTREGNEWPDIAINGDSLIILRAGSDAILETKGQQHVLNLVSYNRRNNEYIFKESGVTKFIFDADEDVLDFIYFGRYGYSLSYDTQIKGIFQIGHGYKHGPEVKTIDVRKSHQRFSFSRRTGIMRIPLAKYQEALKDAAVIHKKVQQHKSAIERYLIKIHTKKHIGHEIRDVTTVSKGEFDFLVHRLNLGTKKKTEDYLKVLDKSDIVSLQELTKKMLTDEVFDSGFIHALDEYFIKARLNDIVTLGRKILALKTNNLKTILGKTIIKELNCGSVSQLENLWQHYFHEYLLFLIFSYKEIWSKVKLDVPGRKRFPDFLGVNHYNGIDVFEIKTHLTPVLSWDSSHENFAISPDLSRAIIQATNYMDAIKRSGFEDEEEQRQVIETTNAENFYRPRGIIIISSNGHLTKNQGKYDPALIERDLTKLRNSLHNIEILTFDEIIDMADNYSKKIITSET